MNNAGKMRQSGEDFFKSWKQGGFYELVQKETATKNTIRRAFQDAYYTRGTTESLISVRRHFRTNDIVDVAAKFTLGRMVSDKRMF